MTGERHVVVVQNMWWVDVFRRTMTKARLIDWSHDDVDCFYFCWKVNQNYERCIVVAKEKST